MTQPDPRPHRFLRPVLLAAVAATLGCMLWVAWCQFPQHSFNEARLAPAFALREGINPYPPLGGGPLSTWIYGPVGILINLPATYAPDAAGALHIASLINFLVIVLPLAVIFLGSQELRQRNPWARWYGLVLATLLVPQINFVLQVADRAAIACGLLSCWFLARPVRPGAWSLALAAVFCALGIWSKQITVLLIAAQVVYLWRSSDRSLAWKYAGWLSLAGGVMFGLAVAAFGWANLWLNLVVVPGRLPLADDLAAKFTLRSWALAAQIVLPLAALGFLRVRKKIPGYESESGRFFQLTTRAFLALLPLGLVAFVKIGGDTNSIHSWDYLLPGFVLAWLVADRSRRSTQARLIAATAVAVVLHRGDIASLPMGPATRHLEIATQLMSGNPHTVWFPRNPVITYYADHQLWHSEDGIQIRFLAHYGLRAPDFRRHLPPNLQAVAYPASFDEFFSMTLLGEFNETTHLPYWTLRTRRLPAQGKP